MTFVTQRIFFLRHGLADRSAFTGGDDRLRPLTDRGIARLESTAVKLASLGVRCDAILTSPLTRCRQTAEIVAPAFGLSGQVIIAPELAPGFNLEDLQLIIARDPQPATVMLVGHEPDFSDTVSRLTGGSNIVFKKGGLARVDLYVGFPEPGGHLVWLLPPKVLAS